MKRRKVDKNDLLKKGNSTLKEFKQFISKGNVIDLAVPFENKTRILR